MTARDVIRCNCIWKNTSSRIPPLIHQMPIHGFVLTIGQRRPKGRSIAAAESLGSQFEQYLAVLIEGRHVWVSGESSVDDRHTVYCDNTWLKEMNTQSLTRQCTNLREGTQFATVPGVYVTKQPRRRAMMTPKLVTLLENTPCWKMDTVVVRHIQIWAAWPHTIIRYQPPKWWNRRRKGRGRRRERGIDRWSVGSEKGRWRVTEWRW